MNSGSLADLSRIGKKGRGLINLNRKMNIPRFIGSLIRILKGRPHIPPSLEDTQLLQIILRRRSVRRFTDQSIPDDIFNAILEAGRVAPSTVNLQTWSFAVFDMDQWRAKFEHFIPFRGARAVIILADTYRLRQAMDVFPDTPLIDHTAAVMNASLAAMNMNIAAEALGISSVMLSDTGRTGLLDMIPAGKNLAASGCSSSNDHGFRYAKTAYPPMPPRLPMEEITFTEQYKMPIKPFCAIGWMKWKPLQSCWPALPLPDRWNSIAPSWKSGRGVASFDLPDSQRRMKILA
jgi:hypothetical protein